MPIYYTYLIGWSNTSMFYYGVRYAKNAHPSELFISYFTSSKHVKNYINIHGEPDIIQIRKTFSNRSKAIKWEHDVLNKMNLKEDKRFLNATNNPGIPPKKFNRAKNFEKWNSLSYEEKYDKETRKKLAEKARQNAYKLWASGKANSKKPEDTINYKIASLNRWSDPEFRKKSKSRKHMNNGIKSKMVLPEDQERLLKSGWKFGRL